MTLEHEIAQSRQEINTDGYEMSIGEIINLYRDEEIIINPEFQRLFRWDSTRKTRFIESLLLGIPIPPIFVFQKENGVWELIDGLQRLSTVLEFVGELRDEHEELCEPSILEGTAYLPSLAGTHWSSDDESDSSSIGRSQQLQIKRARIRVEILRPESEPRAKYELFQRLNTGGAILSEQEVRNCVAVMLDPSFLEWLVKCAEEADFRATINQTDAALEKQSATELALRFFSFRAVPYTHGLDVHEYLDDALIRIATDQSFDREREKNVFDRTFAILRQTLHDKAFKRWDGTNFTGKFLMSVFEVLATGTAANLNEIQKMDPKQVADHILQRAKALWENEVFQANSGAGIRGTTRLARLLPMAEEFMKP